MTRDIHTFCRICEAHCGLIATVDGEEIVRLKPDKQHPVSQGYVCVKGLAASDLHTDPDRVNQPLKRIDGQLKPISWEQALDEIGARVRQIRRTHGDRSVGMYSGNPTFFSLQNVLFSTAFLDALGSPNHFASHSIDVNPKFDVSTQIYGLSIMQPIPDFDHTELFICMGSNPMISQMSVLQLTNALDRLKGIERRGGRVVILDPRRTETAARVGEHHAILPGTDVYFLLGMLHVIAHEQQAVDHAALQAVARGTQALCDAAADWAPERCAALTGISASVIRELARAFLAADGACLYMSTGVNMGPFGSLAYWLLQGLHLVAGHLDRKGGLLVPRGAFDAFRLARMLGLGTADAHRTLVHQWHRVAGSFPVAALPEEIDNDHPERIRALFVSAGNPVHSTPGDAMAKAIGKLDLLVCIDLYQSETARHADYILPATDMLERSDFPVSWTMLQDQPHAQYTPAVVPPQHARRPEWRIFSDLAIACGAPILGTSLCNLLPRANRLLRHLGAEVTPDHLLALLLRWGGQVSLSQLKENPQGVALEGNRPGTFLTSRVATADKRVHLDAPRILADLPRLAEMEATLLGRDPDTLLLIGRRQRTSHNSWMHNVRRIPHPNGNVALMHPDDAKHRGIGMDDPIRIWRDDVSVTLPVKLTTDVMAGVLVVPHGWGHQDAGLPHACALGGVNINDILPMDAMEPVSGQSILLAHPVRCARA
ncbi:MAG: molybdopterin-dependent oxidoreductase [Myxococcota bacterium]